MINFAQYGLLIVLSLFLIIHICILLKFIPYTIVWGGRLKSDTEMYRFEAVSILINLFFLFIILIQSGFVAMNFPKIIITVLLWAMTILFLFNTFGNILSKNKIEQRLFAPLTIILTILSFMLAWAN